MRRLLNHQRRRRGALLVLAAAALVGLAAAAVALATQGQGPTPPPEKQAILDRSMHAPANPGPPAAKGRGAHQPPFVAPPAPAHAGQIGTPGELGGVPVPFSPAEFQVTNMWMDQRGVTYLNVYAGSLPSDPGQGALIVSRTNSVTGADLNGSGVFLTPARGGPLTLTGVRAQTVSFSYPGGSGTFDLARDQFSMGG